MRRSIHRSTLAAGIALLLGSSPAWAIFANGGFETGVRQLWYCRVLATIRPS